MFFFCVSFINVNKFKQTPYLKKNVIFTCKRWLKLTSWIFIIIHTSIKSVKENNSSKNCIQAKHSGNKEKSSPSRGVLQRRQKLLEHCPLNMMEVSTEGDVTL